MIDIGKQLQETWAIHNRTMLLTIRNIPDDAFAATLSTRGGRDIARQLAHVHNVRVWRVASFAKKNKLPLAEFDKEESPPKSILMEAFEQSGTAMERYVGHCAENGGAAPNFKRGAAAMVGYYISHEAHHRGHLLLTMKQCGFRIPDALKWGIWEWNKI